MPLLGEMLVNDKVITKKQLEEGIQNQVIFGGRLGTNLVEMEYIDEQTLTKYLAKKHGVPTVAWRSLNRIKPDVLKIFTQKLAKSTESFPVKIDGKALYVVMADPGDLEAIQEISFATQKKVNPLVLPEIRVFDLLTRFYKIGRELRYINLAMKYQVSAPEKARPEASPRPAVADRKQKEREEIHEKIDFDRSQDLMSDEEFQKITDGQYAEQGSETPAGPEPEQTAQEKPGPEPLKPAIEQTQPETQAPPPEPAAKAPPAGSPEQYRKVAQGLYSLLMKRGVQQYLDKETLQEFLKVFVKSQLTSRQLSLNYLANWMIIEANASVEWLEEVMEEFRSYGPSLNLEVYLPGEQIPAAKPVEPAPAAPAAEDVPKEVVEPEELTTVEEQPSPAEMESAPSPEEDRAEAKPAEDVLDELEAMEASAETVDEVKTEQASYEILELSPEEMATADELESFVPEEGDLEGEEQEVEAEEYVELSLEEARHKILTEVNDRNDISRIVLGFAQGFFKRSLLFTVRGETLYGWDGRGPGINTKMAESIMLPLTETSVFQLVTNTMSFFLGPLPPAPVNQRFLKILGGQTPNNAFIMPVVVNEKVVYMLYGDNGEGEFVPVNAPEVQILAYQIPAALETLIKRKKAEAA